VEGAVEMGDGLLRKRERGTETVTESLRGRDRSMTAVFEKDHLNIEKRSKLERRDSLDTIYE
jgi:hypothetical protein